MPSVFLLRRCRPALQKSRTAVARLAGWWVCGEGERVREAGGAIATAQPDIVACDLRMLDGYASRLIYEMRQWPQRPQVLLLSASTDDLRLFDVLCAGASSYASDTGDGQGLSAGLRQLVDRRAPMTPQIAQQALAVLGLPRSKLAAALYPAAPEDMRPTGQGLSHAEQHLLSLLAHGWLIAEIGERWLLGPAELEQRVWRIYTQLHQSPAARLASQADRAARSDPAERGDLGYQANQAVGGAVSMKLWREASFS